LFNATYNLLNNAQAAIVASGTATLETAMFNVPQMVVYKGNPVSIGIARMLIKIRFISLVNLIMDKLVVKELIQADYNNDSVKTELDSLLHDKVYRDAMLKNYDVLDVKMGTAGASAKTAALIIKYTAKK
jgi:lipid-A-disaccharide synthase